MSKFSNRLLLLLAILALAACQSGPEPALAPEAEAPQAQAAEADQTAASQPLPEPEPEPVDYYQLAYEQAVAALKGGDTELALELLLQVSVDAPDKPYVFTNLGLAYFKLQQLDLAEQAFRQALERNDEDAVAHNHLGILQRQKGEFEDARNRYLRAIDIDSDYARAYLNLGILFDIYLQDLNQALRHYRKYQALISEEDSQVAGWIVDIERRLNSGGANAQG